ncbi:MAG: ABC transporter ATP-binding protein [Planctomycetes bacterium]|nr:ABC transporter ATP-binding protein [Planctomycetota bacterium]
MPPGQAIQTVGLRVEYKVGLFKKRRVGLEALDLAVQEGEIFGYLGPNGAGKTTTIKCLVGVIEPAAGAAMIFGRDARTPDARSAVGYSPENPYFYEYLTGTELLDFYGRLSGLSRAERIRRGAEALDKVGLSRAADVRLGLYSKGMRQRLGLAQAVIHRPRLVILDEPMSGLDPVGRSDVREFIRDLRRSGSTIFFSTHILSDVEAICDHVGVLHEGRLIARGELSSIVSPEIVRTTVVAADVPDDALAWLGGEAVHRDGVQVTFHIEGEADAAQAFKTVSDAGGRILSFVAQKEDLESAFMRLTGLKPSGASSSPVHMAEEIS